MSFISINGYKVLIANATPRAKTMRRGRRGRSFRGQMRDARRYVRRAWDITAVVLSREEGDALERLVCGEGHFFDLQDGFQAATGLSPVTGGVLSGMQLRAAGWGAFGHGFVHTPLASTTGVLLSWDPQLDSEWTVILRRYNGVPNVWQGCALRSDGVAYVNGVPSATFGLPSAEGGTGIFPRVTDGIVEIVKDGVSQTELIDDVVVLPYRAAPTMMVAFTNPVASSAKFGPCPLVRVTGDFCGGQTILCVGDFTSADFVSKPTFFDTFGWVSNGKVVKFTLGEVETNFDVKTLGTDDVTPMPPGSPINWYDAQDVDGFLNLSAADGVGLSAWTDKGSRAQNLTQITVGSRPTWKRVAARGKLEQSSGVTFNGTSNDMISMAAPAVIGDFTVAVVYETTTVAVGTRVMIDAVDAISSPFRISMYLASATQNVMSSSTAGHTSFVVAGQYNAGSAYANNGLGATLNDLNGVQVAETLTLTANAAWGLRLGSQRGGGSSFFSGNILEVLVWDSKIPLSSIDAYFVAKYGAGFPQ